jgi:uncharacterized protein (TIGR01777 family)
MHVVIAGGSGFLGRALTQALARDGHRVSILTRRPRPGHPGDIAWTPTGASGPWARALEGVDAVVNLAGEGIADKRWTAKRKVALRESRLRPAGSLAAAIGELTVPPRAFLSASGIDFYGDSGDDPITESAPAGTEFLARLTADWEAAPAPAAARSRLVLLRTAPVLGPGGVLARMLPAFNLGIGGRLGSGRQWMAWIALDDWVALVTTLLADNRASGPFNLSAPNPVTNADFTRALGRALHRPAVFAVPAFALRLGLGELASVLLASHRVVPARAEALGFAFTHPRVETALAAAVR